MFRKKINTEIQENKISCWDIAKQNLKLLNEGCEALVKTLKVFKTNSNLMKSCKKIDIPKNEEIINQTVQGLKDSINTLKISKIHNRATRKFIDQNPTISIYPTLNLPN